MLKLKMMPADDAAAGRRRLHIKAVRRQCEATNTSGVDNGSPDWQTPLNGIISTLRERLITCAKKQLEGTQKYINEADRVAHIDTTHAIIVSNTRASSGSINA